jgi:hypothetical protein
MAKNTFSIGNFRDFEIVNENRVVGNIRIKPSGILWKPKNSHVWFRVDLETFATFMKEKGSKQKQ